MRTLILCLLLTLSFAGTAKGHDWYPSHCCHGRDCAKAIVIEETKTHISLQHPEYKYTFKLQKTSPVIGINGYSEDVHWHICVSLDADNNEEIYGELLCVFPPNQMG